MSVKTLTRFKSVSKTWQPIISSPEFIQLHYQYANRLIVFVNLASQTFRIHELDSPLSPSVHWYNPASTSVSILASCEFFLLINFHVNLGLVLLNPSTGRYFQIPYPPSYNIYVERYGMYLDDANNDYKVVRINQKSYFRGLGEKVENNMEAMVDSLRSNKGRLIERTLEEWYSWCSIAIGHLFHIVFAPGYMNTIKRIGCFDILAEKLTNDVPMPPRNLHHSIKLAVLDGLLCVTTEDSMWVMKEYGVKDSWFKLMSFASNDIWDWRINTRPIAFRKGSQDEVLCRRSRNSKWGYIWYNVREKKATTATIDGIYGYICKGSLVDFPGGRNMKRRYYCVV